MLTYNEILLKFIINIPEIHPKIILYKEAAMKRLIVLSLILAVLATIPSTASAYTLSGDIDGGVWFGGITYVYAVSLDFTGGLPDFYIGLALLGNGLYSVLFVPEGDYILFAYQDRDNNLIPSVDDYFGFYGELLPEIVSVSGNVGGLDIEISPLPATTITGTLDYSGTNTGLTFLQAATDPEFEYIEHFSILLDSAGSGEYTIFTEPGEYYIRAFMDLDWNFTYTAGDPMGYFGFPDDPALVDVTGGSASNINFTLYDPLDLDLTLEPVGGPIIIPAQGGEFQFTATLENNGVGPALFDVWTDVLLPDSSIYGPIILRPMNMPGGSQIVRIMTQAVPAAAPAGTYTYRGFTGNYPDEILTEDSFTFDKSAGFDLSPAFHDWTVSGWEGESNASSDLPPPCRLYPAYPNPFNNSTQLMFTLEDVAEVKITLYDIQGRCIADLANGSYPAGFHWITVDGSELPSGVYFSRMVSGNISTTVRLILQK